MISKKSDENIQPVTNNTAYRILRVCTNPKLLFDAVSWRLSMLFSLHKKIVHNGALRLFWFWEMSNLGDEISPFIVQNIAGMEISHARYFERNKVLAVGSIINCARNGDVVWGSGAIEPNIQLFERDFRVAAVRGPKTREVLLSNGIDCPEIYGDPGMLISDIYPAPHLSSRPYRLGIVPHYKDKKLFMEWNDPAVLILDIQSGREKFFRKLWQCQRVVSSSLHGIIFAESYGIPAHWMVLTNEVFGGEFKFHDYYLGTDRDPPRPLGIEHIKAEHNWVSPRFKKDALLCAFPRDIIMHRSGVNPSQ